MRDGCGLADKALGGKSSCSECPFSDCVLSERRCAVSEGLHGIELEQNSITEATEVVASERLRVIIRDSCALDGFLHRWLPAAPKLNDSMFKSYSRKSTPAEYWVRKSIDDIISLGGDLNCFECGVKLTKADDVYRRRYDSSSYRVWCEYCCIREVLAVLAIRRNVGNWIIKMRSYERIWKAVIPES